MRNIILDQAQNHDLIKKGCIQRQLLSKSEIQYLLDEVRKIYPENMFLQKGDESTHPDITTSYIDNDLALRKQASKIIWKILSPRIDTLLDNYRILSCGLFIKAPKGGWLDLHHHPTVVESLKHWVINIWCPLQETDFFNGTFCAIPESHKIFPEFIEYPCRHTPFYKDYAQIIRENYSVVLPSQVGEAVIFEDSMLHWSPQNTTDYPRYAIHCSCIPKEATPVYVYYDPNSPQWLKAYEVTDDFFVESSYEQLTRLSDLNLLTTIPNLKQSYTLDEFKNRMQNAAEIRRCLNFDTDYSLQDTSKNSDFPESNKVIPMISVSQNSLNDN